MSSSSSAVAHQHQHQRYHGRQGGGSGLVPLAALIKEEARTERRSGGGGGSRICARDEDVRGSGLGGEAAEEEARRQRPLLRYGCAAQSKKGEDFFLLKTDCPRPSNSASSSVASQHPTFAVFAVSTHCHIPHLRSLASFGVVFVPLVLHYSALLVQDF